MRELFIDGTRIADDEPCYVIAEIGHNHQGNLDTCKQMFLAAKNAGANAVKLQKRDNKVLYTEAFYNSPYNSENAYGPTYGAHREALEFNLDQYVQLKDYAKQLGITFFATAFDIPSADFLMRLGVPAIKIASGDLTNIPLLKYVGKLGVPLIVSTGGGSYADTEDAWDALRTDNFAMLQCTSGYPLDYRELNLRVIETYRRQYPHNVIGVSDHTSGIAMATLSYALGARIIEKHFTLNRAMKGTDQSFSLEPSGLKKMVRDLARARLAMGDGIKRRYASENIPLAKQAKNAEGKVDGRVCSVS